MNRGKKNKWIVELNPSEDENEMAPEMEPIADFQLRTSSLASSQSFVVVAVVAAPCRVVVVVVSSSTVNLVSPPNACWLQ